jgi:hypothetical protein
MMRESCGDDAGMMPKRFFYVKNPIDICSMNTNQSHEKTRTLAGKMFTEFNYSIPLIADTLGITDNELEQWMTEDKWMANKKSLLTTKHQQLQRLYDSLETLTTPKADAKTDPKDIEQILKFTHAIKNLETDTSVGQIFEVGKLFIDWLCKADREKARDIVALYDQFIREQLNIAA